MTIDERIEHLRAALKTADNRENMHAHRDHWLAVLLMMLMLGASAIAGAGGLFFGLDSRYTGGIALIPGIVSVIAAGFKFDARANFHRRKRHALNALMRRLMYELPEQPTAKDVGEVSSEWSTIDAVFQQEYEKLSLDWKIFRGPVRR